MEHFSDTSSERVWANEPGSCDAWHNIFRPMWDACNFPLIFPLIYQTQSKVIT